MRRNLKSLIKYHKQTIERLEELLKEEHGGCDDTTCDIQTCMSHGYSLWAIELFSGTGAASDEYARLYNTLPKYFYKVARLEADKFIEDINSIECKCGAYVYEPEWCDGYCSNCGHTNKDWKQRSKAG